MLEHFLLEMLCISNHTACCFGEKRGFSALRAAGAAPPPPHFTFFKVETLYSSPTRFIGQAGGILLLSLSISPRPRKRMQFFGSQNYVFGNVPEM